MALKNGVVSVLACSPQLFQYLAASEVLGGLNLSDLTKLRGNSC